LTETAVEEARTCKKQSKDVLDAAAKDISKRIEQNNKEERAV